LGGTIGFRSDAHGSHEVPSHVAAPQVPQPWPPQSQPGNDGQNSSHSTTQTVFVTFFISRTTLQVLLPQDAAFGKHAGAAHASPAAAKPGARTQTAAAKRIRFTLLPPDWR
jgi:hypothetical protein